MDFLHLIHHTMFGGIAAAGFGVLFNTRLRALPWCFASGALALAVRTIFLERAWSFEAASFMAAFAVGIAVRFLPAKAGVSRSALHVVGCIPMIPGGFAAKAILGMFAITGQPLGTANDTLATASVYALRVVFTICALGTGLAIPALITASKQRPR